MKNVTHRNSRWLATPDRALLEQLLSKQGNASGAAWSTRQLRILLDGAVVRPVGEIPLCVVRLGSTCEVENLELGEIMRFTLCMPTDADLVRGRISVLSPLGVAVLGRSEGVEVREPVPGGHCHLRISRVTTPKPAKTQLAIA